MKQLKKFIVMFVGVCILGVLVACSPSSKGEAVEDEWMMENTAAPVHNGTEQTESESQTRIITDMLGRSVEIPIQVERIVPLGNAQRMCTYLGVQDMFVTISESDLSQNPVMAYGWYHHASWEKLPVASSGGYGVFHPEVILEADPDVIVCTYEAEIVADIERQTGIPVVAVAQGTLFGEDYDAALRILGDVCGVIDRAEEIIDFIDKCLADLQIRTEHIPDDQKLLVLGAAATFRGGHGITGVYVDMPVLRAIGANDAAIGLKKAEFDTGVEVDKEKLLQWNPEIIFLDSSNVGLVEAEYIEDPGFFKQLQAFENGMVYQWPNSTANYTNVEIPLVSAYYAGSVLYPDAFADIDINDKANEIFSFFLNHDNYLQVLQEHNCGYGPVRLGD